MKKLITIIILIFLPLISVFSQASKPRISVIPFNPVGISKNDAHTITGIFETALVKTDHINQKQFSN